ncbi:MAG: serine hydrolase [Clostridia bacterium]|nr:serine hydrolase [Clostridia bacterium]
MEFMSPLQSRLLQMFKGFVRGRTDFSPVPFYPQKTDVFSARAPQLFFKRTTPETVGLDSAEIGELLSAIEGERAANVHNLLILRGNKVVCEASAPGYSVTTWCQTYSMAKSLTAIAIGMLVDDGRLSLSDRLCDLLFDEILRLGGGTPLPVRPEMKAVTIRDLLAMSVGVNTISETTAAVCDDWTRTFLTSKPEFTPGSAFRYNSLNTSMLSVVVRRVAGMPLGDFLTERLMRPLGIRNFLCEKGPEGIEKGGWGMYISPEDMARVGRLFLQKGRWEGKRILSDNWINLMTRRTFATGENYGDYDYGLHAWVSRDQKTFLFSGMLGQNMWLCPDNDIVVVLTAGNDDVFERSAVLRLVERTLGPARRFPAGPLPPQREAWNALCHTEQHFCEAYRFATPLHTPGAVKTFFLHLFRKNPTPLPAACGGYVGSYTVAAPTSAGLLPMFVRFMQNNHTEGVRRVSFTVEERRFIAHVEEGSASHTFEIGFYGPARGELNFRGEHYVVQTFGQFSVGEAGEAQLRVEMIFPEIPHARRICFVREQGGLRVSMTETPGRKMLDAMIATFIPDVFRAGGIVGMIRTRLFDGVDPLKAIGPMTEPVFFAARDGALVASAPSPKAGRHRRQK